MAAYALNRNAAIQACSWGQFQVMGFNYQLVGFPSVEEFVRAHGEAQKNHLAGFVAYIKNKTGTSPTDLGSLTCLQAIRQKNWASFAYNYNGSEYGNYDQIMENNYNQIVAQEGD